MLCRIQANLNARRGKRIRGALNSERKIQDGEKPSLLSLQNDRMLGSFSSTNTVKSVWAPAALGLHMASVSRQEAAKKGASEKEVGPLGRSKQPICLRRRNQVVCDVEFIRIGGIATIIY